MGSIAQYLNSWPWGDRLPAGGDGMEHAAFWIAVLQIVVVNILLSGDNAVVVAMACRRLPPRQRFWGILIGAGTAAMLLVIFAAVVTPLMMLPYVKLGGGLALFYIAVKLLAPENADAEAVEAAAHLWRVVRIVVATDVIMSLDNIIAVAAVARGDLALLAIGLAVSIPIVLAGAALVAALFNRFPILVWAGAALLGWIAGEIIAADPAVSGYLTAGFGGTPTRRVELMAAGAGAVLVIAAGGLRRRLCKEKPRADA